MLEVEEKEWKGKQKMMKKRETVTIEEGHRQRKE
jgi:hypothetical protein